MLNQWPEETHSRLNPGLTHFYAIVVATVASVLFFKKKAATTTTTTAIAAFSGMGIFISMLALAAAN